MGLRKRSRWSRHGEGSGTSAGCGAGERAPASEPGVGVDAVDGSHSETRYSETQHNTIQYSETPNSAADLGTAMITMGNEAVNGVCEDDPLNRALAERERLLRLCMYALDRTPSAGVAERISEGLGGVGVFAIRPDGERFDPAYHEAAGTVTTGDPALEGLIAETEVPGFVDRDRLLRAPVVTVYRVSSSARR